MIPIWKGKLAIGGRSPEEFEADIIDDNGTLRILRRNGYKTDEIAAPQIRGDYWLRALADLAKDRALQIERVSKGIARITQLEKAIEASLALEKFR